MLWKQKIPRDRPVLYSREGKGNTTAPSYFFFPCRKVSFTSGKWAPYPPRGFAWKGGPLGGKKEKKVRAPATRGPYKGSTFSQKKKSGNLTENVQVLRDRRKKRGGKRLSDFRKENPSAPRSEDANSVGEWRRRTREGASITVKRGTLTRHVPL